MPARSLGPSAASRTSTGSNPAAAPIAVLMTLLLIAAPTGGLAQTPDRPKAEDRLKQARQLFDRGRAVYEQGDFASALKIFKDALKLASRPSILLNIAQCHRQLRHTNQALFYYKLYLGGWTRKNPGKPSPYDAEVNRHIRDLQALAARSTRASFELRSRPPGARIWLDGRELSMTTPAILLDLSPGAHSLVLRTKDRFYRDTVTLAANQRLALVATLERIRAKVRVTTLPAGAAVFLGNSVVGKSPVELELPPGQHTIELRKEGRLTERRLIKVEGPDRLAVDVTLRRVGLITVSCTPAGATVHLDGKPVGAAPVELQAAPGKHSVRLTLASHAAQTRQVQVASGKSAKVTVALKLLAPARKQLSSRRTMKILGWTALGVGIAAALGGAALITGGVIGDDEAARNYREYTMQRLLDEAVEERVAARRLLTGGIVTASVGVAAVIASIVLLTTAPDSPTAGLTVGISLTGGGAAACMGGTF